MSRQIKFRAWDTENKCWRYGWLTKLVEGARKFWAIISDEGELTWYYIHEERSIGQYTGIKGSNGVEIYEGDIVTWLDSDGIHRIDHVAWRNGGLVLCNGQYTVGSYANLEVIGNIYENPELLEGKSCKN